MCAPLLLQKDVVQLTHHISLGEGHGMQESAENYLEAILILGQSGPVRSVDVAGELNFTKPSVSVAMKNLRAGGHISIDAEGLITLTDSGLRIAKTIYERHTIISDWLISLGVDSKTAVNDACRMEHAMSPESFAAIKQHLQKNAAL